MMFEIIKPKLKDSIRLVLYFLCFLLMIFASVSLSILSYNLFIQIPFFLEHINTITIVIILFPIISAHLAIVITRSVIDKSELLGYLSVHSEKIIVSAYGNTSDIPLKNVKFIRFSNAMGWSISIPDAYKIQIVKIDDSVIDIAFIRSRNRRTILKQYIKERGIKTREWNL